MRELAGYLTYRLAAAMVGLVPPRLLPMLGEAGGRLAFLWAGPRRHLAERHMRRVLGTDAVASRAARRLFASYGRYWAEVLWLRPRHLAALRESMIVDGIEHLRAAREVGRGVILALPHVGNWEVAAPVAREERLHLTAVAESLSNRRITAWFVRLRAALGIDILLTGADTDVARELLVRLRRGEAVALVADRDVTGRGVRVPFFGEETSLPPGPVSLALRTGAPVLPVAVYFREGWGHRAVVQPPLDLPYGGSENDRLATGMRVLAQALETLIRAAPTQWHLLQPNWPSDTAD